MDSTTRLTVRKPNLPQTFHFPLNWNGGAPFTSQWMNALSMSFPVGEQYFIDSLKRAAPLLPELQVEIKQFTAQEATHRFVHQRFNQRLEQLGLKNHWQHWAAWRIKLAKNYSPLTHLAVTAAYEHFTASLSGALLKNHALWLSADEPDLERMWLWHSAEETEHCDVALTAYRALGGGEARRIFWFIYASNLLVLEAVLQTSLNLWRSNGFRRWDTWRSILHHTVHRNGYLRQTIGGALAYLKPGFSPESYAVTSGAKMLSEAWLNQHQGAYQTL